LNANNSIKAVICHSDSKQDVLLLEQELARAANHAHVPFFLSGEWLAITPALRNIEGITALDHTMRTAVATITKSLRKPV